MTPRCRILVNYAEWTALSAVKRGPIRDGKTVHQLLDEVAFAKVLSDETKIRSPMTGRAPPTGGQVGAADDRRHGHVGGRRDLNHVELLPVSLGQRRRMALQAHRGYEVLVDGDRSGVGIRAAEERQGFDQSRGEYESNYQYPRTNKKPAPLEARQDRYATTTVAMSAARCRLIGYPS